MSGLDVSEHTIPCGASNSCRHQICQHCGEPMRLGSSRATDHPGTKTGTLQDQQCRQCRERGGPPELPPEHCVNCNKPFRPRSASPDDYPGTVQHEGHGQCQSCYREQRREETAAYHREVARLKRKKQFEAQQHEIAYEGHIRMSDTDMERIKREYPEQYEWHMLRRRRIDDPEFRQHVYKLSRHDGRLEELMTYDQY